jgi:hypothetical protein
VQLKLQAEHEIQRSHYLTTITHANTTIIEYLFEFLLANEGIKVTIG